MSAAPVRITPLEISRDLKMSERSVWKLLESGEIPNTRLGRKWIISRRVYERWKETLGERPQVAALTM